eukprot:3420499-Prymnesium_polylepis.2
MEPKFACLAPAVVCGRTILAVVVTVRVEPEGAGIWLPLLMPIYKHRNPPEVVVSHLKWKMPQ